MRTKKLKTDLHKATLDRYKWKNTKIFFFKFRENRPLFLQHVMHIRRNYQKNKGTKIDFTPFLGQH